ncbi:MAG: beta-ketoacyl-[acyl-carrier-protein] synthase family protein [Cyanobacteriota bacterium]|jgi:3-oxoacyl-[acyl-carrier-protein] synthase II|nr:beta-ketoacyl-[acyl-carrier-protein] synthase family protein [Cyanobacteriota bacterium]
MTRASRIAITGSGAITPLGMSADASWRQYLAGESGIRGLAQPWAGTLPCRIAGQVGADLDPLLDPLLRRRLDRCSQLGLLAAREAWAQAGLHRGGDGARVAVVVGCGIGGLDTMGRQARTLDRSGASRVSPLTVPMLIPNAAAAQISIDLGLHGGAHTPVSACASSAEALLWGQMLLTLDRADVVLAGGSEAPVNELGLVGFSAMRALSTRNDEPMEACRPYGQGRDGFVLAEGAGLLVLEREDDARARGADCLGYLLEVGCSSDAHHIATPDPEGRQAAAAMSQALQRCGLLPKDLAFLQAHATGTVLGDLAEARAIRLALGQVSDGLPVTAPKGQLGHLLGGAGAVETILALRCLASGLLPPSRNADPLDPAVDLAVVQGSPHHLVPSGTGRFALKNAFGFGGHNFSLVMQAAG